MKPASRPTLHRLWLFVAEIVVLRLIIFGFSFGSIFGSNPPAALAQTSPLSLPGQLLNPLAPDSDPIYQQALIAFHGPDLTGKDGPLAKIGFDLTLLSTEYQAYLNTSGNPALFHSEIPLVLLTHNDAGSYVVIDAIASGDTSLLATALAALGLRNGSTYPPIVSGELPIDALPALASLVSLRFARPALVETNRGAVESQADRAVVSDQGRSQLGVDGTGVRVGVLSDSFNCLGGAAADIASGDLPADMEVLADEPGCVAGKDEGRAMIQLIADIAPGAHPLFHSALGGQAAFANAILTMADQGHANVVVDDVRYLGEPIFQDGIIAQAVDQVMGEGVAYFASAGNNGRHAYESPFEPALDLPAELLSLGLLHDFDPGSGVDPLQQVTIPVGETATFNLQWDQPYASASAPTSGSAGSTSDLDLLLLPGNLLSLTPLVAAIDKNVGGDPIEVLRFTNPGPATTFNLAILHLGGPLPAHMKYVYSGYHVTVDEYDTGSGTLYGHAAAQGARAVGAAFYGATPAYGTPSPRLEQSSSSGPALILFDSHDEPINQLRAKPELVAPDGQNTTFFGVDIADPGDGSDADTYPNFYGTSAAAPNAAAVAALLLEMKPSLTPSQLYDTMQNSAIDMGAAGVDDDSGYGLVQALAGLAALIRHDLATSQLATLPTALPGQPVAFVLVLTNKGPGATLRVDLSDTLPNSMRNITAIATAGTFATSASSGDPTAAGSATFALNNLKVGEGRVITFTGIVDPDLDANIKLTNQSAVTSIGDNRLANNQSQATINVTVPHVSFESIDATGEDGENKIFKIVTDLVNPYAPVKVRYTTSSDNPHSSYPPVSGLATIPAGQSATTISIPSAKGKVAAGETITIRLSRPNGSQLGSLTAVTLASGVDNTGNNGDNDGDTIPDQDDSAPDDPCRPNPKAGPCDQEPDGLTNDEENLHGTNPTLPDSDGDGIKDGDEVSGGNDPLNPCDPPRTAPGCDSYNDGGNDGGDPPGHDPNDSDGDGVPDGQDPRPNNPCVPDSTAFTCAPQNPNANPPRNLFLPALRG